VVTRLENRRVRRTCRLLREALVALILEKGYDAVTVQDVLDRADVGRATFYAHFRDKDDLLASGFEELRESLRAYLVAYLRPDADPAGPRIQVARPLFEHAASHRRLYRALVGRRGGGVLLKRAHDELSALFREHLAEAEAKQRARPVMPVEVVVEYTVSALLGLLTWWLDGDLPYTAEQMGRMFERLAIHGIKAALLRPGATVGKLVLPAP
jgi:AcrR family transcriptional regulator